MNIKLWKVTVNDWGWNNTRTIYCRSKEQAKKIQEEYPANDGIEYAGMFTEDHARHLLREDEI